MTALSEIQLRTLRGFVPEDADFEFLPFGAVVSTWAMLADELPQPIAQAGHFQAALREACAGLQPDSPFYSCRDFKGFHECLASAIKELAAWGFDPESLDAVAADCSPTLRSKLLSIASLQRDSEGMLEDLGRELNYRHVRLSVDSVPDVDVTFPRCLIVAGSEVTPLELNWIEWAASVGTNITVAITSHPGMFPASARYEEHLEAKVEEVGETSPFLNALFTSNVALEPGVDVSAFYAADPLAEVEWALRGCLAASDGEDFSRLGIYARNLEEYAPLIESAAMRLKVPVHLFRRAELLTNSFIRTLLSTLKIVVSGDVRQIERLARSSYVGLTQAQRKELRDAAGTAHREAEDPWGHLRTWVEAQLKPDSLELAYPWLLHLLDWRRKAIDVLKPTSEWIAEMGELYKGLTWLQTEGHSMERDSRARHALERALAQEASIQNVHERRPELSLAQFVDFACRKAAEADTSLPVVPRGVQVASSADAFGDTRRLYVLGMLEGVFPRRRSEDPVLTDLDRKEIGEHRKLLFPMPDSFEIARAERDEFLSVCAIPSEAIVFSYPETTDDRDNIRAFYLEEVKRAVGGNLHWPRFPRQDLAPAIEECFAESDRAIRSALDGPKASPLEIQPVTPATRTTLVPEPDGPLAPRELRTAIECPFRHFATELLKVYPDRERRRWHRLRDLPQTGQLGMQATEQSARIALHTVLQTEIEKLKTDVEEWELNILRTGGERLIEEWIDREFTARQIWPKDEGSEKPQTNFGQNGLREELPRVGHLKGTVAGVSRMGPYNVVHLVESSTPTPDRNSIVRLKDRDALYYGLHLLAAFERDSATAVEVESMSGGRKLLVLPRLAEPALVGDIERGLEVLDLGSEADPAIVRKVFFDKVKDLLETAARAIREVDVRPNKGEHCQWCDHGELCRSSSQFGEDETPFEEEDGD